MLSAPRFSSVAMPNSYEVFLGSKRGILYMQRTTSSKTIAIIWYREMLMRQGELNEESLVALLDRFTLIQGCETIFYRDDHGRLINNFVVLDSLTSDVQRRTWRIWECRSPANDNQINDHVRQRGVEH